METNITFNRKYLEQLNELFSQNNYFLKSIKKVNRNKKAKGSLISIIINYVFSSYGLEKRQNI